MKSITLTKGYHALVDDDDYEWANQYNWYANVKRAVGSRKTSIVYAVRKEWKTHKTISMAIEIAKRSGVWKPHCEIDHIDTNRLNNMRKNLRAATGSQNQANQLPRKRSSKYKGVFWSNHHNRWRACIRFKKKLYYLGDYKSEEDAAKAYDKRALELSGEFARINFPS